MTSYPAFSQPNPPPTALTVCMNYTAGIPREVMGKIISTAASSNASSWTDVLRIRYAMALVNKDWRNALLAERSLWAFLSIKRCTPAPFIKAAMEVVKQGSLTLEIDASPTPFAPALLPRLPVRRVRLLSVADFVATSLDALSSASPHLIGLIIRANSRADTVDIAATLSRMSMDHLSRVKIEVRVQTRPEVEPNFVRVLPLAEHILRLDLDSALFLPFKTAVYAHLTALKLAWLDVEWSILGSVLRECSSSLERLEVTGVTPLNWQDFSPLTLPSVTTLDLRYSAEESARLLSAVRLPALRTLRVDVMHFASLSAAHAASPDAFGRATSVRVWVTDGEAGALASILPELGAATELDFRFCPAGLTDLLLKAVRDGTRLPRLSKLHIPTEPPLEDLQTLFNGHFSEGLIVVTVFQDERICEFTSWSMSDGVVLPQFLGGEGSGPSYCGWELDW